jgi:hypothetical protein
VTDAEACAAEIVALHRLFESWLGAAGTGDPHRFETAFAPGFAMVMPNGTRLDRAEILAFLQGARAGRGEGFRIRIEECFALHEAADLVLMHYVERQWLRGQETARRAAALFRTGPDGPRWLFVQETWISPPV